MDRRERRIPRAETEYRQRRQTAPGITDFRRGAERRFRNLGVTIGGTATGESCVEGDRLGTITSS
jgi:hypothetical protein